ncbi:putative nuclease HARBI1 [Tanacetum coccineum]
MLRDLSTNTNCRKTIRMSVDAFKILCQKLENQCGLRPTQQMSVEEQVARFLHIVGNDFRTRYFSWLYRRSVSATRRHFHKVLNAIISLEDQYIKQVTGNIVQKEIQDKPRFYPFFKDYIGAIDGTHVRVRVPNRDAPRYRGCKYYLVDGGLPHRSTLIAPYRGVRYHLKEYSSRAPQNPQELFNLRHSSLRNSIERAFGVLKKRFSIIRSTQEPFYSCDTQVDIFLACCILHNFLLEVDRDKELEDEVIHEMLDASHDEEPNGPRDTDNRGEQIRNSIANDMWSDYMLHPNNKINISSF